MNEVSCNAEVLKHLICLQVPIRHVLPGFNTIPRFSGSLRSRLLGATTVGVLSEPSHDTGDVEDSEGLPP